MSKKNYNFYIDLGSSKIRAAAFHKDDIDKNVYIEKDCLVSIKEDQLNLSGINKNLEKIILELEKKTSEYLSNLNLMIDTSSSLSVSLSISKNYEGTKITKEKLQYLVQDAKQQILQNYNELKIIHIIINNYSIDNENYNSAPFNINCEVLTVDITFICFSKKIAESLENLFNKYQISITQMLCTSYAKSINYRDQFTNFENIAFIDLGFEKTSIIIYKDEKLNFFNILPIGGNHITKDISKILNLNLDISEKIKINLNSDILFSEKNEDTLILKDDFLKELKNHEESLPLIKKIIFARIDEILDLCFRAIASQESFENTDRYKIVLMGNGSKILNDNSIYIKESLPIFEEILFFEESVNNICDSGIKLSEGINNQEVILVPKKVKKNGFFEKLFHLFNRD